MFKRAILTAAILIPNLSHANSLNSEDWGDIGQIAIPLVAIGATIGHDDKEGVWQATKGIAITAGVTHLLKNTTGVLRPNGSNYQSFPSGHTSAAFSGAAFLHHRYGLKYGIPAYLAASYVGYSRVKNTKHWETDVIAGAALAITVSYLVTSEYKDPNLSIEPARFGNTDAQGINFSYSL
ncbi:phosphatase PAP2 family protein [Vibrio splendidus]|uniref:phosphatase PAP2 family protein n=1 Tax=Vibrio splendidus TaxID=29497 RepID=UPI000C82D41E|nr:phosphatase PAP2 family protein [Vibrio splendidus]PMK14835.1 phosphoesterase [Vibrio splendidus]